MHTSTIRPRVFVASVATAVTGVALGVAGYWIDDIRLGLVADPLAAVLDIAWRALALLALQSPAEPAPNWPLRVGRLLASIGTLSALLQIAWESIRWLVLQWKVGRLRDHVVILGSGPRAADFGAACGLREGVHVASHASLDAASVPFARIVGDPQDPSVLRSVGVNVARLIIVADDSDAANLAILNAVTEARRNVRRQLTRVIVDIRDASLARALNLESTFTDPPGGLEVEACHEDTIAARQFLELTALSERADLRALDRVQLVMVGWTPFSAAVLEQLARTAPFRDFALPRVDVFCDDPAEVVAMLRSSRGALLRRVSVDGSTSGPHADDGEATSVVDLHLWRLDDRAGVPDVVQMTRVEDGRTPSVVATVVSGDDDATTAARALQVRELSKREGRWSAPLFVRLRNDTPFVSILRSNTATVEPQDQIIPVGQSAAACAACVTGDARERAAESFHHAYLQVSERAAAESAASVWRRLPPAVRDRNRRAVDHIPAKLMSAGWVVGAPPFVAGRPPFDRGTPLFERLAELEHIAWERDLVCDGWRAGPVRDDDRRIHPAIGIPFHSLDDELGANVRQYDYLQLRVINDLLDRSRGDDSRVSVRPEFRVALAGRLALTPAALDVLQRRLPPLIESHCLARRDAVVTLMSPLAPGSDVVLLELALDTLRRLKVRHRVLEVRALPRNLVADFALEQLRNGGVWRLKSNELEVNDIAARRQIVAHLGRLAAVGEPHWRVADIQRPGTSIAEWVEGADLRETAYRSANAYMVQRADLLVASVDRPRALAAPGGTDELITWARDPGRIPLAYRKIDRWRSPPLDLVVLETGDQRDGTMEELVRSSDGG